MKHSIIKEDLTKGTVATCFCQRQNPGFASETNHKRCVSDNVTVPRIKEYSMPSLGVEG